MCVTPLQGKMSLVGKFSGLGCVQAVSYAIPRKSASFDVIGFEVICLKPLLMNPSFMVLDESNLQALTRMSIMSILKAVWWSQIRVPLSLV